MRSLSAHIMAVVLLVPAVSVAVPVGTQGARARSTVASTAWRVRLRTLTYDVVLADRQLDAGLRSPHAPRAGAQFRACGAGFAHVRSALISLPTNTPEHANTLVFDVDNAAMYGQGACSDAAIGSFAIASWYRMRVDRWTRRAKRDVAGATR
jgi:hypothetical protein